MKIQSKLSSHLLSPLKEKQSLKVLFYFLKSVFISVSSLIYAAVKWTPPRLRLTTTKICLSYQSDMNRGLPWLACLQAVAQGPRPLPSCCCTTWRLLLLTVHTDDIEKDQRENIPFWIHMNLPPKMLSYWLFREDFLSLPQTGSRLLHPRWKSMFPLGSLHTSCGSSAPSGLQGESPKENGSDHRASQLLTSNSAILSTIAHLGHISLKLIRILVP